MLLPFSPNGATAVLSGSTTSASGTLNGSGNTVRVFNASSAVAFVRFGIGAPTAVATDVPVGAGGTAFFSVQPDATHAAAILSTGTGSVHFTRGMGAG